MTYVRTWTVSVGGFAVIVAALVWGVKTMPTLLDDILSIATVLMVALALWAYTVHDQEQQHKHDRETWGRND